jgi:hypothetical protein
MRKVLLALFVMAAVVIGLGFYLKWFSFTPKGGEDNTYVPIKIDKEKIKTDVEKGKEKTKDLTEKGKEKAKDLTEKGKEKVKDLTDKGKEQGGASFKLKGPETATTVKHGETKTVELTASESKDFKEDVALTATVDKPDADIKTELKPTTIKGSDPKKAELSITVGDKTPAGDSIITVTGKPTKGNETTVQVKVNVPEKK